MGDHPGTGSATGPKGVSIPKTYSVLAGYPCSMRARSTRHGCISIFGRTLSVYSGRSAVNGSTLAARPAGIVLAASATAAIPPIASA